MAGDGAVGAGTLQDFLDGGGEQLRASDTFSVPGSREQSAPEEPGGQWSRSEWDWSNRGWQSWSWSWYPRPWGTSWYGEASASSERDTTAHAREDHRMSSGPAPSGAAGTTAEVMSTPVESELEFWAAAAQASQDRDWSWHGHDGWRWQSWNDWHGRQWDWRSGSSWNNADPFVKPDLADPPAWPGWSHRRQWVLAIRRWNKHTDVPLRRRAERVLRGLGWEMQVDFEHLPESLLESAEYLEEILRIIDNKAGVREDDEKRKSFKAVMSDNYRKKDETLAQFAVRRQRDFTRAAEFGVHIPPELKASMLKEGAALSEQNLQNLTTLVGSAEHDPDMVCRALGRMDVRTDKLVGFADDGQPSFAEFSQEDFSETEDEDEEALLAEMDGLNLMEDQIHEVFAVLENRKRTWKENKLYKANLRKSRGSFVKTEGGSAAPKAPFSSGSGGAGQKGAGRGERRLKMNKEQLKKITRCKRCNKKGHWAEDCHLPPNGPKIQGFVYTGSSGVAASSTASTNAFSYLAGVHGIIGGVKSEQSVQVNEVKDLKQSVHVGALLPATTFLTLSSGDAIIDTGATQDLIGQVAFAAFSHTLAAAGLRPIMVDTPVSVPLGIGGAAKVRGVALVPVSPGRVPGILEFTILEHDVPPLLSVGFLEFLGAEIKLVSNQIFFSNIDVKISMHRLSTGHRTIPLVNWKPRKEAFPIPDEIKTKFGLQDGAFDLDVAPSDYMKGRDSFPGWSSLLWSSADSRDESVSSSNLEHIDEPNLQDKFQQLPCQSRSSEVFHVSVDDSQDCKIEDDLKTSTAGAILGSESLAKNPMGSLTTRPVSQFDQPPLSANHGGCWAQCCDALARPAGPSAADLGDIKADAVPISQIREEEEQLGRPLQVCGADQRSTGFMPSSRDTSTSAWQPVRELDSVWGLWQQDDLCSQEPSSQEQGEGSVKTTRRAEFSSSRVSDGGAGPERDGAVLRCPGFPAGSAESRLCLELGAQPFHRGDEEPVRLHAGHDVRDGSTELSAVHDDGKAWKHHGVNGKQSVPDADDDVTGVTSDVGCLHGNDEPSARGGLSQCGERRGGECLPMESPRQHGEPQSSRSLRPKWSSKVVTAAAAWSMMVPFRHPLRLNNSLLRRDW